MRVCRTLAIWSIAALWLAPVHAQETGVSSDSAALDGIDRSLKRIVELLQIQVGNQRAELAIQRLDVARRELVARERELHGAEADRDAHAQHQEALRTRIGVYGAQTPEETGMKPEDFEMMQAQLDVEAEALKQRIWRTDQRIVDLRNEIARVREDLETWENLVLESFEPD